MYVQFIQNLKLRSTVSVSAERYISVVHPRHWFVFGGRVIILLGLILALIHIFQKSHINMKSHTDLRFVGTARTGGPVKFFPNCVKFGGNNANLLGNYRVIYALNE